MDSFTELGILLNYHIGSQIDKIDKVVGKLKSNPIINRLNYKEIINSLSVRLPLVALVNVNTSHYNILMAMVREGELRVPSTLIYAGVTELFKKYESRWGYFAASLSVGVLSLPLEYLAHSYLHGQTENLELTVVASTVASMVTAPIHLYLYKNNIFNMTNARTGIIKDYAKIYRLGKSDCRRAGRRFYELVSTYVSKIRKAA